MNAPLASISADFAVVLGREPMLAVLQHYAAAGGHVAPCQSTIRHATRSYKHRQQLAMLACMCVHWLLSSYRSGVGVPVAESCFQDSTTRNFYDRTAAAVDSVQACTCPYG